MDYGLIGRDAEIGEIQAFVSGTSGLPAALAITGDPGIGKTAVWAHVLQGARAPARVLSCQPASAERPLTFSALDDLFGAVAGEVLPVLPEPMRRAVATALLRGTFPGSPLSAWAAAGRPAAERRALARGILETLRILSRDCPLLLAVDDAQWLDRASAAVLEFCFRRLDREPVCAVLTFRAGLAAFPLGLDRALPPDRLRRVRLGPLSLGAIGEILRSRLGASLPRYALTKLYDACGGNPLYALECAHAFPAISRMSLTNEPIPLPESLSDLVRSRVRRLTPDVRQVGRLVAASSQPRERVIRAACDDGQSWAAIDLAIDAAIIERDGDLLRFTHPLLRSALYADMTSSQRRDVHRLLAASAEDIEERAWHLALSADRPAERTAQVLDRAARHAAVRGAAEAAAALAEQAIRLTPAGRPGAARDRTVQAAGHHFRCADMARSQELIQSALTACPPGPARAPLLLRLATIQYHQDGWPVAEQTFRQAAEQACGDPALGAYAEQELAVARLVGGDLPDALRWAKASLRSAERAGDPSLVAHSLARIAALEFFRGNGVRQDLLDRAEALDASVRAQPDVRPPLFGPALARGLLLKWCDRLDEARPHLAAQHRHALGRGDEASLPFLLYHLSELECWAGNWGAADTYALEGCRVADESRQQTMAPATLYALALVRSHLGQVRQARELASDALARCERTGNVPVASQVLSVLGFIELSLDDYPAAHARLGRLADAIAALGLGEPSVVKFLPDEIEVLAALGQVGLAWSLTRQLEARGRSLRRRWALAAGARCRAHLAAIDGDLDGARAACQQALSHHEQLPMPFELARTLLIKGMTERRARRRQAARQSLGQALALFEHLGAPLWAGKARRELSKITTLRSAGGLTETEHRIAALIARGQTNREVATAMFITENTVQTHVRHIFQKLGVRSRTELAARLLSGTGGALPQPSPDRHRPGATAYPATANVHAANITDSGDSAAAARN